MNESNRATLRTTLSRLLQRTLQTYPLPIDPKKIYYSCFPGQVRLANMLWDAGEVSRRLGASHTMRNFLRMARTGTVVDYYLYDGDDHDYPEQPRRFWVGYAPRMVCVGDTGGKPLFIADPEINRLLTAWWKDFSAHETAVDDIVYSLYQVVEIIGSRTELQAVWPELLKAVPSLAENMSASKYTMGAKSNRVSRLRQELNRLVPEPMRERIIAMLAGAMLLPECKLNYGIQPRGYYADTP